MKHTKKGQCPLCHRIAKRFYKITEEYYPYQIIGTWQLCECGCEWNELDCSNRKFDIIMPESKSN